MSRVVRASGALLLTGALVASSAVAAGADTAEEPAFTLTILHGNDPESHLLHASADAGFGGAARYATLIQRLREDEAAGGGEGEAAERGVVTVNSGDMYLPGPELAASLEEGAPFYDALVANEIGYDAVSMGNHEFDFGPDFYARFVGDLTEDTTVVAANVDVSGEPELAALAEAGRIAPSTVVDAGGERVGVVGALYPDLASISSPRGVVVDDVVAPVQDEVDRLTADGVDKIVLISHLQNIGFEQRVGAQLTGVDVIVSGGGHEVMAAPDDPLVPGDSITADPATGEPLHYPLVVSDAEGGDLPIVTAGSDYKYVGRLVVNFDDAGELVSVADRSGAVRVSGTGDDAVAEHPTVRAEVTEPVASFVESLGETEVARSEVGLDGRRDPGVRTQETNLGDLMADALLDTGRRRAEEYGVTAPQIGIQNGGGIRNGSVIPAGPLTVLDTYSIAPFANQTAVVPDLPRTQIKELLEHGVSAVPAADGRFMQVGGVNFAYDPERTAQRVDADGTVVTPGERIRNAVLHDGTVLVEGGEVVDGPPVSVATNDFSARGGDMYPFRGAPFTVVGTTYQGALESFVTGALEGRVTAADYPEGGAGRIVVGEEATDPGSPVTGTLEPVRAPVREGVSAHFAYTTDAPGRDNAVALFAEGTAPGDGEPVATAGAHKAEGRTAVSTRGLGTGAFTAYLLDGEGAVLAGPAAFEIVGRR
jgi:5'-nucleotidase